MTKPLPELFYKYTARKTAQIVLEKGTLRWSTPTLFNDPYDLQFDLHIDADREAVRARGVEKMWYAFYGDAPYTPHPRNQMGQMISGLRGAFPKLSRQEFEDEFGPGIDESYDNATRYLPGLHADFRAKLGTSKVLCQSEVPDSLLMWAYYAEQHKGVVLCFRAHAALGSPWRVARPVVYSREMPRLCDVEILSDMSAGLAVLDAAALIDAVVYTKAAEWAHEHEWRLQAGDGRHPEAAYEDVPFHPQELDAVIFGCVTPQSDRDALTAVVRARYPHAKILTARKDDRQFRLLIEETLAV
jgi:hypothetical protein